MAATDPDVSASVLGELLNAATPTAVYQAAVDAAHSRLSADHGGIAIDGSDGLEQVASIGDATASASVDLSRSASNLPITVYRTGRSCLVGDLSDTRSTAATGASAEQSAPTAEQSAPTADQSEPVAERSTPATDRTARSLLAVPFGGVGVVYATATTTDAFSDADRAWLDALSSHAATALERVSDRAEQTRQLRERVTRYEAFASAHPDYAFLYDAEGRYVDAFLGWEKDAGRTNTAQELIGKRIDEVLPADAADAVGEAVREAAATGTIRTTEYRMETETGLRRFEGRATPVEESVRGDGAVVFAARDITDRYETRQELKRQNERLDRFAGVVSHDLRNPLNVAQGRLDLARDAVDSEHLDLAVDALDRIEALVEDTLVLARQGQTVSETETVQLPEIARRCWSMVTTGDCELEIRDEFAIQADPDRLQRLFENLYRNSVEHGSANGRTSPGDDERGDDERGDDERGDDERGDPDVTVRVGRIDGGFYLEDDGTGIPVAERGAVFDVGYSTSEDGTGFGLRIVSEVVEAHGWTIDVVDGSDGGTRFEITGVEESASTDAI